MAPYVIQMAELVDGGFAHAMLAHLGGRKLESLIHFGGVYGFFGGIRGDGVGVAGGGDIQYPDESGGDSGNDDIYYY